METPSLGTTLIAVKFSDGVVLASDTKISAGRLAVSRSYPKVQVLHHRIVAAASGVASHGSIMTSVVRAQLEQLMQEISSPYGAGGYSNKYLALSSNPQNSSTNPPGVETSTEGVSGETSNPSPTPSNPPLTLSALQKARLPTVHTAAKLIQQLVYEYKNNFMASFILAGWDNKRGPEIYAIPMGGTLLSRSYAASGSGSPYILSFLEEHFQEGLTREKCEELIIMAMNYAVRFDGSSGGSIRMFTVCENSLEERVVLGDALPLFS